VTSTEADDAPAAPGDGAASRTPRRRPYAGRRKRPRPSPSASSTTSPMGTSSAEAGWRASGTCWRASRPAAAPCGSRCASRHHGRHADRDRILTVAASRGGPVARRDPRRRPRPGRRGRTLGDAEAPAALPVPDRGRLPRNDGTPGAVDLAPAVPHRGRSTLPRSSPGPCWPEACPGHPTCV